MFSFIGKVTFLWLGGRVLTGVVEGALKEFAPEDHKKYVTLVAEKKLVEINQLIKRNGFTQEEILPQ